MGTAASMVINVGARTSDFDKGLRKARTSLSSFAKHVASLNSTLQATGALAGVGLSLEKAFALAKQAFDLAKGIESVDRFTDATARLETQWQSMQRTWAEMQAPRAEAWTTAFERGLVELERAELQLRESFFAFRSEQMGDRQSGQHLENVRRRRREQESDIERRFGPGAEAQRQRDRETMRRLEILGQAAKKQQSFDEALRAEFRSPLEKFQDRMRELQAALARGGISQGVFDRAAADARDRFDASQPRNTPAPFTFRAPTGSERGTSAAIESVARFQEESRSKLNEDQARQRQLSLQEASDQKLAQLVTQLAPQMVGLLRTIAKQEGASIP